jgi:hypothetical protein
MLYLMNEFVILKVGGSAWESNPPAALSDGTPDLKSGSPTSELSTSVKADYNLPGRSSQGNLGFQDQVLLFPFLGWGGLGLPFIFPGKIIFDAV